MSYGLDFDCFQPEFRKTTVVHDYDHDDHWWWYCSYWYLSTPSLPGAVRFPELYWQCPGAGGDLSGV